MKNKILQEFLNSNIKIKSIEKLEQYIEYCILNNKEEKIKFKTEHHHILPEKLFSEYTNIRTLNPWNGSHLLHKDHYIAHSLLAEALSNSSMTAAWWGMNNKNHSSGKIEKPEEIIGAERFANLREKACKGISDWYNKEITINGVITTNADNHMRKLNDSMKEMVIFENKEMTKREMAAIKRIEGMTKEKLTESALKGGLTAKRKYTTKDGEITSISKERNKKALKTMHKEFENEDGIVTTIMEQSIKKTLLAMNKEFIDTDGKITTKMIQKGKKLSISKLKKSKTWNVYNINDELIHHGIYTKDLKLISQSLPRTNKNNRLGNNIYSVNNLKRSNKEYLIGHYAEEIK